MKLLKIIRKNFKVLFRSKSSAFVVLVGPLIIIGLIALALSNTEEFKIGVGVVAEDMEGMTEQFITQLKDTDYRVVEYDSLDACIEQVKLKSTNLCIKFPPNFVLDNEKTFEVEFHVDQSRLNVVEAIKSSVLSSITLKSDEITMELTTKLIDTIEIANAEALKLANILDALELSTFNAKKNTDIIVKEGKNAVTGVESSEKENDKVVVSIDKLNKATEELLGDLEGLLDSADGLEVKPSKLSIVGDHHENMTDLLPIEVGSIKNATNKLQSSLADLKNSLQSEKGISAAAEKVQKNIDNLLEKIADGKKSVNSIKESVAGIEISSASSIVNPFTIEVNPILSTSNKGALLFPYFLTLVILFVGIMLSSTLVIFEKKSRAFFRTFTTPTSSLMHLLASYITNFSVLLIQLIVVFLGAFYYLDLPLIENIEVTSVMLILSITFFISLGTMVGYFFKTQEGTTIASISMGSLFLFLSNLILPVESFSALTRKLMLLNPFMLCSELFKKTMLFNAGFKDVTSELFLLIGYIIVVIMLAIVFQKLSFYRMFTGSASRKALQKPHVTKENCLKLPDGTLLRNQNDLIHALKTMKEETFALYVTERNNELAAWARDAFKSRKLARRIRKAGTRLGVIKVLEADAGYTKPVEVVNKKVVFSEPEFKGPKKYKGIRFKFVVRK